MAKVSGKAAIVTLKDSTAQARTISTDVVSYEIEDGVDTQDVTGLTEGVQNFVPGQRKQYVKLTCFYNSLATTGAFTVARGIIGMATASIVTVQPEGTGLTFTMNCMLESITPSGSADGSPIKLGTLNLVPMGGTAGSWA
jgi:hypothetical protein